MCCLDFRLSIQGHEALSADSTFFVVILCCQFLECSRSCDLPSTRFGKRRIIVEKIEGFSLMILLFLLRFRSAPPKLADPAE